ncbi:MAG TPA: hypothetical protein VFM79_07705 [Pelobium sp.]|nr:hypothetical protein [Pelobium sp.]
MKTSLTENTRNLLLNFDTQLVNILKEDMRQQHQKIKATLVNMATRAYDSELLAIINSDISKMRQIISDPKSTLAQAV